MEKQDYSGSDSGLFYRRAGCLEPDTCSWTDTFNVARYNRGTDVIFVAWHDLADPLQRGVRVGSTGWA